MMRDWQRNRTYWLLAWCLLAAVLSACGQDKEATRALLPVAIAQGDECHVCGMIITNYPGPKGEAYPRHAEAPLKFCSTRDLFSYLLQPENAANVMTVYVHDMAATEWMQPDDTALVAARTAWYVADHPMTGAMGPTLASFKRRDAAEAFIGEHGGRLLRFEDISLEVLASLGKGKPMHP